MASWSYDDVLPVGFLRGRDPEASNPAAATAESWEAMWQQGHENPRAEESWFPDPDQGAPEFRACPGAAVRPATVADLVAADESRERRLSRIAAVAAAPAPLLAHGSYYFSGQRASSQIWRPVWDHGAAAWLLRDGRPVYSRAAKSSAAEGGGDPDGELAYDGTEGRWVLCLCGERRCWTPRGCDAASPADVANGWEYDDGHYAAWGINPKLKFTEQVPDAESTEDEHATEDPHLRLPVS